MTEQNCTLANNDILHDILLESINQEGDGDSSRESGIDEAQVESLESGKNDLTDCNKITDLSERPENISQNSRNEHDDNKRNVKKKTGYDAEMSQQRRRKETLLWQKQRRDEILEKIRQLEDSAYSDSETEDEMDFVACVKKSARDTTPSSSKALEEINEENTVDVDEMEVVPSGSRKKPRRKNKKDWRPRYKQGPCKPMLSEWMLDVPEDFEDRWLGVICPVGKRCIVMASRGKTKIFSRKDEYLGCYKSLLPGGCRYNYATTTTNRNRGVTILDCIWSPKSETFYVLDLICWNSHSCVNCDTDYRQFFLQSKFSENQELLERSPSNPFPFRPLIYFEANETSTVLASTITFPEDIDGIIYFHKEAFYISETNPLCLWLLLDQIEPILHIYVSPDLLSRQVKPKNLHTRTRQIEKLENRNKQGQKMEVHHS